MSEPWLIPTVPSTENRDFLLRFHWTEPYDRRTVFHGSEPRLVFITVGLSSVRVHEFYVVAVRFLFGSEPHMQQFLLCICCCLDWYKVRVHTSLHLHTCTPYLHLPRAATPPRSRPERVEKDSCSKSLPAVPPCSWEISMEPRWTTSVPCSTTPAQWSESESRAPPARPRHTDACFDT